MVLKDSFSKTGTSRFINYRVCIFIVIFIVGASQFLALNEEHGWGGDSSQYIHHAKNLAEGTHYLDTGYIVGPPSGFLGPYGYPPIFPMVLAPVYSLWGFDLIALKAVSVLCFCITLLLLTNIYSYQLTNQQILSAILLTGFNPFLWNFTNSILCI